MANGAFAATHIVSMRNTFFTPADLTIATGDTVTWRCDVGVHDTVSGVNGVPSGVWGSSLLFPGQSFSFTFNNAGTFPYYCTPHWQLGMTGTIRVNAPNTPPTVSITSPPDQANFSAPADIILEASASDSEGDAVSLQFFMNGSPLATLTAPPYRVLVDDLAGGDYTFLAVATDTANATATASVSITVTNPPAGTPPAFITQPQSQTAIVGTNVTFNAAASGSAPLLWQWFFNASPIPGATNSIFDITNVQPAHAGEYFVTVSNAFGSAASSNATLTVTERPLFPAKSDFNHDGQTDFLWLHKDRRVILWLMDDLNPVARLTLRNGRPAPFGARIAGTHDFDLDGNVDILWQYADASLRIWLMQSTNFLRTERISPAPALTRAWQPVGLADFDGDLNADILLRHSDGYLLVWYMHGKNFLRQQLVYNGRAVSRLWRVAGVADVNNNGHADILWQDPTGAIVVWFMPNHVAAPEAGLLLSHLPRVNARIVGLNDLNQDGDLDLILRDSQGRFSTWWMNGTNRLGSFPINHGHPVSPALNFAAPRN
jgi:plastocyanin